MNLETMLYHFPDGIWQPTDYTDRYWERDTWGISWTEEGLFEDDAINFGYDYSSDGIREIYKSGEYMLCTLDDGCGGRYQAIFDLSKEMGSV